jgi:ABC-type polysaccharide/polyol phosphate export permease
MLETARRSLRFRNLLTTLTRREIQARYRGSVLGFFWSLFNPLLLVLVYSVVFGLILTPERGSGLDPYPLFLIAGLFPWIWASTSLLESTVSLQAHAGLVRKAVFPVELPPLVAVLSNLVHLLFALPIVLLALLVGRILGYAVGGWALLLFPLVVVLQLPLVAGLALALAALNALFKDVRDLVSNLLTLTFFLTPILYPVSALPWPEARPWMLLNPFAPFTLAYQHILFHGTAPPVYLWLLMALDSAVAWALGAWIFSRLRDTLVEMA